MGKKPQELGPSPAPLLRIAAVAPPLPVLSSKMAASGG